jgi:two-component system cell cycle response regulator CtrA
MQVLLVEDDKAIAKSIELILRGDALNVYTTDSGEEAIELAKLYDYDIVILDLQLPDCSGLEVLRALKLSKVRAPVLILSGNAIMEAKLTALRSGADDYVTKPFHKEEILARLQTVVRRSKGHCQPTVVTGKLTVNLDARTADMAGKSIHLTTKEYQIIELLSLRKGTTVSKEVFFNHLYGGVDEPEMKILDVFICKLRKKLSDASGGENYIATEWARGYALRDPADENGVVA